MIQKEDLDLTAYNSYRVHSVVSKSFFPETEEELINIFTQYPDAIVIGGGCNVIFERERYEHDVFVFIRENFSKIELVSENVISCCAGADLMSVSLYALEKGLSGFELYYDIPGCIGGAIVMNAGAKGEDIAHLLESVTVFDRVSRQMNTITKSDLGYNYRESLFQQNRNLVVIKATFSLKLAERSEIRIKMEENKADRWKKQPREYPSAGSVFKRPEGHFVGKMIDELGLKGVTVGDAQISNKHGGFIINKGSAKGADIVSLIGLAKNKIDSSYNIDIQIEQRII